MTYHQHINRTFEEDGDVFKVKLFKSDNWHGEYRVKVALCEKRKFLGIIPYKERVTIWFEESRVPEEDLPEAIERLKSDARSWYSSQKRVESWANTGFETETEKS